MGVVRRRAGCDLTARRRAPGRGPVVAARAGVGKQTVYRRWPSKAPLVTDAILDSARPAGAALPPDTGDIHRDLRVWLQGQADFLAVPRNASLVRALAAAAADDLDDAEALYRQLTGAVMYRVLAGGTTGTSRLRADGLLDIIMSGLRTRQA